MCSHGSLDAGRAADRAEEDGSEDGSEEGSVRAMIRTESRGYDIAAPDNVAKRGDYISWNDYFLAVAYLSAQRSKDPHPAKHARNGACIVDAHDRIVGIGYDGFPRGCHDDCLPWASAEEGEGEDAAWLATKEPWLCRAEINAILNKCSADVVGGRLFVPNFPSNECAQFIIQAGIREVVYVRDDRADSDASRASRILFRLAGVRMTRRTPGRPSLRLDFGAGAGARDRSDPARETVARDEDAMERHLGLLRREAALDPFAYPVRRRADHLSWDDYFMGVAFLSAQRSKDPSTQVGACIVDARRRILGIGYNGFPRGCSDAVLPWARDGAGARPLRTKYPYVVHAEVNAVLNTGAADARGATLYVALFPCHECCKVLVQAGIGAVVYLHDKYHATDSCRASRVMFKMAGVTCRQHRPEYREIVIDFES